MAILKEQTDFFIGNLLDEEIAKVIDLFHIKSPALEDLDRFFPR